MSRSLQAAENVKGMAGLAMRAHAGQGQGLLKLALVAIPWPWQVIDALRQEHACVIMLKTADKHGRMEEHRHTKCRPRAAAKMENTVEQRGGGGRQT